MSDYETQTAKQLKALLWQRGSRCNGRKGDRINQLHDDDSRMGRVETAADDVITDDHAVPVDNDDLVSVARSCGSAGWEESETIRSLQLQLQIEEFRFKTAQLSQGQGRESSGTTGLDLRGLKVKPPVMSSGAYIITFLASWS